MRHGQPCSASSVSAATCSCATASARSAHIHRMPWEDEHIALFDVALRRYTADGDTSTTASHRAGREILQTQSQPQAKGDEATWHLAGHAARTNQSGAPP